MTLGHGLKIAAGNDVVIDDGTALHAKGLEVTGLAIGNGRARGIVHCISLKNETRV